MKNTKQILLVLFSIIFISFITNSCNTIADFENLNNSSKNIDNVNISQQKTVIVDGCGTLFTTELYAGQNILAGTITVQNTVDSIYITYETINGWQIGKIHLFAGDFQNIPLTNSGNPKIGQFPYKNTFSPMVTSYTYAFDIDNFSNCFTIAAHAEVHLVGANGNILQSETAWGNGTQFNQSGSWAMYLNYCKQECETCVFETISKELYAGQTILMGLLQITNDEENLYITYQTEDGWYFDATHLYVGELNKMPTTKTGIPVPGLFPYTTDHTGLVNTFTYTIPLSLLADCYSIAAHAKVYFVKDGNIVQTETAWAYGIQIPFSPRWAWYNDYCTQVCE